MRLPQLAELLGSQHANSESAVLLGRPCLVLAERTKMLVQIYTKLEACRRCWPCSAALTQHCGGVLLR